MRPRRAHLAVPLAAAAVLGAGCGEGPAPQLEAFRAPEAYLPPMAPVAAPAATDRERPSDAQSASARPAAEVEPEPQGAPTDAEIAAELKEAFKGGSGGGEAVDKATVGRDGLASVPLTAPPKVRAMIIAANQVATKPYVYGGGHGGGPEGVFTDTAYDCSGSMSYALASAGFIESPMASGPMMTWGRPGPGKWVTMYANEGHAFMVVAGLRFDTSGRAERGTRWQTAGRSTAGFVARHPPGL